MVRKLIVLVPLIAIAFIGFLFTRSNIDQHQRCFSRVIGKFKNHVAWKGFSVAGIGGGRKDGKRRLFRVTMETTDLADENQAKRLVIDLGKDFLAIINADENMRPYLCEYPYPIEGIDIGVIWRLKESERESYVVTAAILKGRVVLWKENDDKTIRRIYDEPIGVAAKECEQVSSFQ